MGKRNSEPVDKTVRPTIHEVARRAGLSVGTVSRILNGGNKANWASTAARESLVREIANEIGYRPSYRARSLRSKQSHTVALVYGGNLPQLYGVYESVARFASGVLGAQGYQLLFLPLTMDAPEQLALDVLDSDRIDGCLGLDPLPAEAVELVKSRKLPIVAMNVDADVPRILPDDLGGTKLIVQHLVTLGHKRITFCHEPFSDGGHFSLAIRRKAFLAEMKRHGLAEHADVFEGTSEAFVRRWHELGRKQPTAILSFRGVYAIEMQHVLWMAGVRIPEDVSIATFDELPPMQWLTPGMTTVNVPMDAIGIRATEMLLRSIRDEVDLPAIPTYLPETLVVRASTTRRSR